MKDKDAAIIKVLNDVGYKEEPELSPEQEEHLSRAFDPEAQFLYDVEQLFNPAVVEYEEKYDNSSNMNVLDAFLRQHDFPYKRKDDHFRVGIETGRGGRGWYTVRSVSEARKLFGY